MNTRTGRHHVPGAVETVLLTAWVGGLWFAGLAAAPQLFAVLEPTDAGNVAGQLFRTVFWIGVAAIVVLGYRIRRAARAGAPWRLDAALVAAMAIIALLIELVLHPWIAVLRELPERGAAFGIAHGASSVLYLVECALGVVLVVRRRFASA